MRSAGTASMPNLSIMLSQTDFLRQIFPSNSPASPSPLVKKRARDICHPAKPLARPLSFRNRPSLLAIDSRLAFSNFYDAKLELPSRKPAAVDHHRRSGRYLHLSPRARFVSSIVLMRGPVRTPSYGSFFEVARHPSLHGGGESAAVWRIEFSR